MTRQEFKPKTKALAFSRANKRCEDCGALLGPGNTEYHHRIACELGGDNSLENCVCLCKTCHRLRTSTQDVPNIARAKRRERKHIGIRKPRTITRWRRFNGDPVRVSRERF
jgi:5-methylcytosine-specific restriction protein A